MKLGINTDDWGIECVLSEGEMKDESLLVYNIATILVDLADEVAQKMGNNDFESRRKFVIDLIDATKSIGELKFHIE